MSAVAETGFYRDIDTQVCQGDLFSDMPSIHVKSPWAALRRITIKGGRDAFELHGPQQSGSSAARLNFKTGEDVPAFCQVSHAILLTYDCDIDTDRDHRLI